MFPSAHILGCSTGGQINNNDISDDEIVAAAVKFDATRLRLCQRQIGDPLQSATAEDLGHALNADDLAGVFVLSDGLNVNGSELVDGIIGAIGPNSPLTGGLAGDGSDSAKRWSAATAPRNPTWWSQSGFTEPRLKSAMAAPADGTCSGRAGR